MAELAVQTTSRDKFFTIHLKLIHSFQMSKLRVVRIFASIANYESIAVLYCS